MEGRPDVASIYTPCHVFRASPAIGGSALKRRASIMIIPTTVGDGARSGHLPSLADSDPPLRSACILSLFSCNPISANRASRLDRKSLTAEVQFLVMSPTNSPMAIERRLVCSGVCKTCSYIPAINLARRPGVHIW